MGASHEIKVGAEFIDRWNGFVSGHAGNARYYHNYNTKTVDWDGDGSRDIVLDQFGVDLKYIYVYRGAYQSGPNGIQAVQRFPIGYGHMGPSYSEARIAV